MTNKHLQPASGGVMQSRPPTQPPPFPKPALKPLTVLSPEVTVKLDMLNKALKSLGIDVTVSITDLENPAYLPTTVRLLRERLENGIERMNKKDHAQVFEAYRQMIIYEMVRSLAVQLAYLTTDRFQDKCKLIGEINSAGNGKYFEAVRELRGSDLYAVSVRKLDINGKKQNQDAYGIFELGSGSILKLADGMGSNGSSGAVSKGITERIPENELNPIKLIHAAAENVKQNAFCIDEKAGSTLNVVVRVGERVSASNVGDSHTFVWDMDDQMISQLSEVHTAGELAVKNQNLAEAIRKGIVRSDAIVTSITPKGVVGSDAFELTTQTIKLRNGLVFVCGDGVESDALDIDHSSLTLDPLLSSENLIVRALDRNLQNLLQRSVNLDKVIDDITLVAERVDEHKIQQELEHAVETREVVTAKDLDVLVLFAQSSNEKEAKAAIAHIAELGEVNLLYSLIGKVCVPEYLSEVFATRAKALTPLPKSALSRWLTAILG